MPNIATALKEEIARLSRKEVRAQTARFVKTLKALRSANMVLRAEMATLRAKLSRLERRLTGGGPVSESRPRAQRFSAKGLATHRSRLGYSAADYGRLVGVTGQTIYAWEQEKGTPRASQLEAIAAVRKVGKRQAAARLEQLGEK